MTTLDQRHLAAYRSGLQAAADIAAARAADYRALASAGVRAGNADDLDPYASRAAAAESIRLGIEALIKEGKP